MLRFSAIVWIREIGPISSKDIVRRDSSGTFHRGGKELSSPEGFGDLFSFRFEAPTVSSERKQV